MDVAGMQEAPIDAGLPDVVTDALTSALRDYCSALTDITDSSLLGLTASPEQLERAERAKLRLENARALLELYVGRRPRDASLKRRVH